MSIFLLIAAVFVLVLLFNLVRARRLKEKYVALWMLTGLIIIILMIFPNVLTWLTDLVGLQVPSNLLFTLAIIFLLAVCLQLSLEVSVAEDKSRVLAEHVAILNLEVERLKEQRHDEDSSALPAQTVDTSENDKPSTPDTDS